MLIVRHVTGPLAGKEQALDEKSERVTFGRDPEVCDVVFPPDETLVSRRHFALTRKPSGDWTFDLFGAPYVAVNGQPAEVARPVRTGDRIELGRRGGPSFEVILRDKGLGGGLAPTQAQGRMKGSREMAIGARRLALAGVALGVLAAAATGGFLYLSRSDAARLDQAVASLSQAQARAASESISPAVRDRLLEASYVVVIRLEDGRERAVGTASPIAPNLLATNAHIVEEHEKLSGKERMLVRSPGSAGKAYEIVESRMHPGYKEFSKYLKDDPFYVEAYGSWLSGSIAYDVGTLRVADGTNLSPILEIASPEELADMRAGIPLAMAGYPLSNIPGREVQALGATPRLSLGVVTALTDSFNLPAEARYRRLVHHNLPGTGGNSGSPMLGANGKIFAFHNAGTYFHVPNVGSIPNAALVRFAQRADLLLDLLADGAAAALAEDRTYWAKQTAAFKRGIDVLVPYVLSQRKPGPTAKPVLVSKAQFALTKADAFSATDNSGKAVTRRQKIHTVSLSSSRPSTFIGYAQQQKPLQVYLVIDGKIAGQDDRTNTWVPHVSHKSEDNRSAEVYIVSPGDEDITYTFFEYAWETPRS